MGDSSPIGVRASDGAMLYGDIIDGVQIEVIEMVIQLHLVIQQEA